MPPCPAAHTCCVYLVRHGATDNNLARPPRLQGRGLDVELSVEGRQQAQRTAEFLADRRLDVIYSSPLVRARQTAQAIAAAAGLAVELVDEFVEVDIGQWEGMTWNEVEHAHPKEYEAFLNDAGLYPFLGGETLEQVRARVVPVLNRLMEENLGRTAAIVAHNVVNRAYLAHLMELPLSRYRAIPQDNCGITVLQHRQGRTRLVTLNGLFHLDGTTGLP